MQKDRVIELLQDQLYASQLREQQGREINLRLMAQVQELTEQVRQSNAQIQELTRTIASLQEALTQKESALGKQVKATGNLSRLMPNTSEQQRPPAAPAPVTPAKASAKARGNNGAKRKVHLELEEEIIDLYPKDEPGFDPRTAREIKVQEYIRYRFIPPRIIKLIYRNHFYSAKDTVLSGSVPPAPFQNSQYEASFIAGICQLRYGYSMSVERIVKYIRESGFELEKPTAHGLLAKTASLLAPLYQSMRTAVLEDTYLSCDETYYTILVDEKNSKGKGVKKGYVWETIGVNNSLVYYFYENGSRAGDVILDLLDGYRGTIQSDAYAPYKRLESDQYPDITRLACFQHVKRKFLDIGEDGDAQKIVELINRLYHQEHKHRIGQGGWTSQKHQKFRQKYAPPIMARIKKELLRIKCNPGVVPKSELAGAVEYMLSEWDALMGIFDQPHYRLDNNLAELNNRTIALSRKNSLFFGSHQGAGNGVLFYSLVCTCKNLDINVHDYLTDVIQRVAALPPNAKTEVFRELLPDRWIKQ